MNSKRDVGRAGVCRVVFAVEHGMLMFEDPGSAYPHDDWIDGGDFVDAGPDSVYLAVQPSVDGPVDVTVSRSFVHGPGDGVLYFDGFVEAASGRLVLHDANDVLRFELPVPTSGVPVRIYADQPGLVSKLYIDLGLD